MLYGTPCWIDDILDQLAAQLGRMPGMTPDRVFESLADDESHAAQPPADTFITVRPTSFPVLPGLVSGGGRLEMGFDGTFKITLFSRLASDQELRDKRALRERSRSILRFIRSLFAAVEQWSPTVEDATTQAITSILLQPMRLKSFELIPRIIKGAGGASWVTSPSYWNAQFIADISTNPT